MFSSHQALANLRAWILLLNHRLKEIKKKKSLKEDKGEKQGCLFKPEIKHVTTLSCKKYLKTYLEE